MRACFFGTYNRLHPANRLLMRDLRAAGVTVVECHQPLWERTRDKMADFFGAPNLGLSAVRYLGCASRLALELRRLGHFDLFLAGFNGQLDVLLLRMLVRRRAPVIFAPLMSVSETLVGDRRVIQEGSWRARLAGAFDRWSLGAADAVIADTGAHGNYWRTRIGVGGRPLVVHYLGADDSFFELPAGGQPSGGGCTVLFYGQYLPLHGSEIIIRAAAKLARENVRFNLIGTGPERRLAESIAGRLGASVEFEDWVDFTRLPERVAAASICLGIFGTSEKASMVIPTKVYQAAAAGKVVITAETPAVKEVFTHGENIYLCVPGDTESLVAAVEALVQDRSLSARIGSGARRLMTTRFSPAAQGERLIRELGQVCSRFRQKS